MKSSISEFPFSQTAANGFFQSLYNDFLLQDCRISTVYVKLYDHSATITMCCHLFDAVRTIYP